MTDISQHHQIKPLIQEAPEAKELPIKRKYSSQPTKRNKPTNKPYNLGSRIAQATDPKEFSNNLLLVCTNIKKHKATLIDTSGSINNEIVAIKQLITDIKSGKGEKNKYEAKWQTIIKKIKDLNQKQNLSLQELTVLEPELEKLKKKQKPKEFKSPEISESGSQNSTLKLDKKIDFNPKLIQVKKTIRKLESSLQQNKESLNLIFTEVQGLKKILQNPKSKITKRYGEQLDTVIQSIANTGVNITSSILKFKDELKLNKLKKIIYENNYPDYLVNELPQSRELRRSIPELSNTQEELDCTQYDLWEMILCDKYLENSKAKKIRTKMHELDLAVDKARGEFLKNETPENYFNLQKAKELANRLGIGWYHEERGDLAVRYTCEVRKACQEYFLTEKNDIVDRNGVDALVRQAKNKGNKFASVQFKSSESRVKENNYIGNNPISVTGKSIKELSNEIEEKINNAERTIDAKDFYRARKYDSSMKTNPHMKALIKASFPWIDNEKINKAV